MQNDKELFYAQEFHSLLAIIATNAKVQLNQATLTFYDNAIKPIGYEKAHKALLILMGEIKGWQMPTVKQITDKMEMKTPSLETANSIVGLIFEAVPKFGYMRSTEAKEYIGPIGTVVVQQFGGWSELCCELGVTLDKSSTRAQMRDLALSLLNKEISYNEMQLDHQEKPKLGFINLLSKAKEVPK